jgi:hypothetical protein
LDQIQRIQASLVLLFTRLQSLGEDERGGIGEQTVIRGLIIAGAIAVVGIIVAAVITHAHQIANSISGAGS